MTMVTGVTEFRGSITCEGLITRKDWLDSGEIMEYAKMLASLPQSGHLIPAEGEERRP